MLVDIFAARRSALLLAVLSVPAIEASAHAALVVLPNAQQAALGGERSGGPLGGGQPVITFQVAYSASQLAAVPFGSEITSLGFRLAEGESTITTTAAYSQYDIRIGGSSRAIGSLSSTFADNFGSDTVLARSGAMTIAAGSLIGGPSLNPFFDIPLSTAYAYAGGDLLVTINWTAANSDTPPRIIVDAVRVGGISDTVTESFSSTGTGTAHVTNAPVLRLGFEPPSPIPEPATWAMLIAGFGLVGGVLRSGRQAMRAGRRGRV